MQILITIMFAIAVPFSLLTAIFGLGLIGVWIQLYRESGLGVALVAGFYFIPTCLCLLGLFPWLCTMGYLMARS